MNSNDLLERCRKWKIWFTLTSSCARGTGSNRAAPARSKPKDTDVDSDAQRDRHQQREAIVGPRLAITAWKNAGVKRTSSQKATLLTLHDAHTSQVASSTPRDVAELAQGRVLRARFRETCPGRCCPGFPFEMIANILPRDPPTCVLRRVMLLCLLCRAGEFARLLAPVCPICRFQPPTVVCLWTWSMRRTWHGDYFPKSSSSAEIHFAA